MKDFDLTSKKMPFGESEQYVSHLIEKCADKAIATHREKAKDNLARRIYISVCSVAAASIIAFSLMPVLDSQESSLAVRYANAVPIDDMLESLSDEEASALFTYYIDEIPEY